MEKSAEAVQLRKRPARAGHMPICKTFTSAFSSIKPPPRAIDNTDAAFGFCNRAPSRMCRVSAVSGVCSEMKSAPVSKSSSSSTSSTWRLRARDAERYGSYATTRIPKRNGAPAEFAADPAHSNYAQRFVVELNTFEILFVPIFAANVCVGLRNLARRLKATVKTHAPPWKPYFHREHSTR